MLSSEEMMTIRDDAIRMLEEEGFVQKTAAVDSYGEEVSTTHPDAERRCLMGAIGAAAYDHVRSTEEHAVVCDSFIGLWCEANKGVGLPIAFNDADGRTADEVIETLRNMPDLIEEKK